MSANYRDAVAANVAAAPPLTREQRDRILTILRPTTGGGRR